MRTSAVARAGAAAYAGMTIVSGARASAAIRIGPDDERWTTRAAGGAEESRSAAGPAAAPDAAPGAVVSAVSPEAFFSAFVARKASRRAGWAGAGAPASGVAVGGLAIGASTAAG